MPDDPHPSSANGSANSPSASADDAATGQEITIRDKRIPAQSGTPKSLVVFLHGYGADGTDLLNIGFLWQSDLPDTTFIAPDAPFPCAMNPGGFQWFSLMEFTPDEVDRGAYATQPLLEAYLNHLLEEFNLPPERLFIVGFSQGTMMALHTALRRPDTQGTLGGIIGFSGLLPSSQAINAEITSYPPVHLIHGTEDAVVPFTKSQECYSILNMLGISIKFDECPQLEHGINELGLTKALASLEAWHSG